MSDPDRWGALPTEARNATTAALDTFSTEETVAALLDEDRRGIETAATHAHEIARLAEQVAATLGAGGDVLLVGAGTSGRLAVLEAAECPPTFGTDPQRIRAAIAGGDDAVFHAREGAEDRAEDGRAAASDLTDGDLVIGLSASGVTAYVRGALDAARGRGIRTALLTCASRDVVDTTADTVVALDTGPEVLTGSTRLKAGSATKAALNAVTTAAMVRLGKVYDNLMVDLRPGSAKLRDRARRIVEVAGEVTPEQAQGLLASSSGDVKVAIVMARRTCSATHARQRLEASNGHVRRALRD